MTTAEARAYIDGFTDGGIFFAASFDTHEKRKNVFAEIKVTSVGGIAGNLTYLVFSKLNDDNNVGEAAAGGLIAVVLANIVAAFLVRLIGRNLEA